MGAEFDKVQITMRPGNRLMNVLKQKLEFRGERERMNRFRHVIDLEFPDDESPNVILDTAKELTTEDLPGIEIPEDEGVTLTVEAEDKEDLPMILEIVSKKISEGYTSGYEPTWAIEGGE